MAKSEFSETQFVFGYLSERYANHLLAFPKIPFWQFFMFPSTIMEKTFPVDFMADFYTHSEYYQFKRSEFFNWRRGTAEINANLPISFMDYYRIKIYNKTSSSSMGQFDLLKSLASRFPTDLVCYCAPCFHTETEFHTYFNARQICSNSVIIDCNQFNTPNFNPPNFDINDGANHVIVYKPRVATGYICSEPYEILVKRGDMKFDQNRQGNFKEAIQIIYNDYYLKDELVFEKRKQITDINLQLSIAMNYLFEYHEVFWQPKFRINE